MSELPAWKQRQLQNEAERNLQLQQDQQRKQNTLREIQDNWSRPEGDDLTIQQNDVDTVDLSYTENGENFGDNMINYEPYSIGQSTHNSAPEHLEEVHQTHPKHHSYPKDKQDEDLEEVHQAHPKHYSYSKDEDFEEVHQVHPKHPSYPKDEDFEEVHQAHPKHSSYPKDEDFEEVHQAHPKHPSYPKDDDFEEVHQAHPKHHMYPKDEQDEDFEEVHQAHHKHQMYPKDNHQHIEKPGDYHHQREEQSHDYSVDIIQDQGIIAEVYSISLAIGDTMTGYELRATQQGQVEHRQRNSVTMEEVVTIKGNVEISQVKFIRKIFLTEWDYIKPSISRRGRSKPDVECIVFREGLTDKSTWMFEAGNPPAEIQKIYHHITQLFAPFH